MSTDEQTVLDTRARILEAALELFSDKGFDRSSLREIAGRLGITKAAILYHFPSKTHLFATLIEPLAEDLTEVVENAATLTDLDEVRRAIIEGSVDVYLRHRRLLRLVIRDITLMGQHTAFVEIVETITRAHVLLAGPDAGVSDRIRAVQVFAMLGDPIVFFADLPTEVLRAEVLAGVRFMPMTGMIAAPAEPAAPGGSATSEGSEGSATSEGSEGSEGSAKPGGFAGSAGATGPSEAGSAGTSTPPAPTPTPTPTPAPPAGRLRRGVGRPSVMDGDRAAAARRMYAAGEHSVAEIAMILGVSRATVYRHLGSDGADPASADPPGR